MSDQQQVSKVLYEDSMMRVVTNIYLDSDGKAHMNAQGVIIEARFKTATGEKCWMDINRLPNDQLIWFVQRLVNDCILGWRDGCPWIDLRAAGAKR